MHKSELPGIFAAGKCSWPLGRRVGVALVLMPRCVTVVARVLNCLRMSSPSFPAWCECVPVDTLWSLSSDSRLVKQKSDIMKAYIYGVRVYGSDELGKALKHIIMELVMRTIYACAMNGQAYLFNVNLETIVGGPILPRISDMVGKAKQRLL